MDTIYYNFISNFIGYARFKREGLLSRGLGSYAKEERYEIFYTFSTDWLLGGLRPTIYLGFGYVHEAR